LFPEFSFKISVVSELGVQANRARSVFEAVGPDRSEFPIPKVFFQKICGFWAGISCSQSFLSKDLWFLGQNFLFPEAAPIS
jgi:hypothetical protein